MNGDSYSSRGMASTNALPRIRKHETDSSHPNADAGRHGSSRDYYVSLDPNRQQFLRLLRRHEAAMLGMHTNLLA